MRRMLDLHRELTHLLEEREGQVALRMRAWRESLPEMWAEVRDPDDEGPQRVADELDFALLALSSHTAVRIHDALARLHPGLAGRCADCGRAIGRRRLAAIPFAESCLDCQRAREEAEALASPGNLDMARTRAPLHAPARNDAASAKTSH